MLQHWQQIYDPMANIWISSLIALIPIIFFFLALAVFRLKGVLREPLRLFWRYWCRYLPMACLHQWLLLH